MANGYLTTHVLDTARGQPAAGMTITLIRVDGSARTELAQMVTNADGRTDSPILPKEQFSTGTYELQFDAGSYFDQVGIPAETPRFLDLIPIRFGISDDSSHYHVPLLVSPFGFSTYRGS